jgi:signal transduction histidine kinase
MSRAKLLARSVRGRASLAAGAVVAVALLLGALLFDTALTRGVEQSALASAEASAERIAARVGPDGAALGTDFDDDELVQILTPEGTIAAASPDARDIPPLRDGRVVVDNDAFIVAHEGVKDSRLTVLVAHEIDDGLEVVATARWLLATSIPALIAFVALGAWILTGRALAPVTRIRAEVEDIEAARLGTRLKVPDTGDEVAHLASTMNHMLDRLDAAARAQRRFVADASHELRSPLAVIHQHAEVASLHPGSVSVNELAEVVLSEGARLQGLVDALLLLARLEEGAEHAHQVVDLDDLALDEVHRARRDGVRVDGAGIGAARVHGNPRLLGQVLRNLVDNAVRHARSQVAVSLVTRDGIAELIVDDDGHGIPPRHRADIFDRFVRLDEARARDQGGAGLGLAIVHEIVETHSGSVTVDDSPQGGARFVVRLPTNSA